MQRGQLRHAVLRTADGGCAMAAVALPVGRAVRVGRAAHHARGREHLQRGNGAPAKVLVRRTDARVRHVDMDTTALVWWRVVLVHGVPVVDAVKAPRRGLPKSLLQQCGSLFHVLLRDGRPRLVRLHDRLRGPRAGVNELLDVVLGAVHDEGADASVAGIAAELELGHVLSQLLELVAGAPVRKLDDPPEHLPPLVDRVGVPVHDDRRATVDLRPGAELLGGLSELCQHAPAQLLRLEQGGPLHRARLVGTANLVGSGERKAGEESAKQRSFHGCCNEEALRGAPNG
mmetsp:Transcript_119029/g.370782  ORF Transcript_119029/g.370782 Transcript_119029/m.370782 type:complete len:287 (+) Transcript_119029:666-1526(+)